MIDDDEDYPPEGGCLGIGATHDLGGYVRPKKIVKRPIGFVHFPDKSEKKPRARSAKRSAKKVRRK